MKAGKKARERRAEDERKRMELLRKGGTAAPAKSPKKPSRAPVLPARTKTVSPEEEARQREEETREFLAYLEQSHVPVKDNAEPEAPERKPVRRPQIVSVNLENGMPAVEEALSLMRISLQQERISGVRLIRLIHGWGSTGRGGKIRTAARQELERLRKRGAVAGYVPGEDFGPYSAESRRLTDLFPQLVRDPDYGKYNQGITIVLLRGG